MSPTLANEKNRFWPKGGAGCALQDDQSRIFLFAFACAWCNETFILDALPRDFFFKAEPYTPTHPQFGGLLPAFGSAISFLFLYPLPKPQVSKILAKPQKSVSRASSSFAS
jgi:hypothetical protein